MTVAKKYGGFAIAVHDPARDGSLATCRELVHADRIDYFARADYRPGRELEKRVRNLLDLIIARIRFAQTRHEFLTDLD
jgi:hypothetical protein